MSFSPAAADMGLASPTPAAPGAEGVPAPFPPSAPIDFSQLNDTLEDYLKKLTTAAKEQTNPIHQRCQHQSQAYMGARKSTSPQQLARDLNFWAKINEAADQWDDETNLLVNLFTQDGRVAKVIAGDGERQERADVVDEALDFELRAGHVEDELEKSCKNYVGMPFSGLKSCREYYEGVNRFYVKAVNPSCFAVSDVGRKTQKQFSVHELHFFTKREMRQAGFKNLEKLGKPDATGKQAIIEGDSSSNDTGQTVDGTKPYKIWETWVSPVFQDWVDEDKFASAEAVGFCEEWDIPFDYLFKWDEAAGYNTSEGNLLRFYHDEKGVILKVTINYLTTPKQFPHHCASFHTPLDGSFSGESMTERSADIFAVQEVLFNNWLTNLTLIGNQSMFVSQRAQVSPDQLQKIYEPRGQVFYSGNDDPEMLFKIFKPDSIGKDMMDGIQFTQQQIEKAGVNAVMQGISQSRTATESRNDNARGQMQVNAAGTRYVRECLLPAVKDVVRMIVADYGGQWLLTIGEDGKIMMDAPPMTDPDTIDRHFEVAGVTSFDYIMQYNMVAELTNVLNTAAPVIPPDVGMRMAEVIIGHTRVPRKEKEFIFQKQGTLTNIADEIETLSLDPYAQIEVLDADDHLGAIKAVMLVAQGDPMTMQPPNPGFLQYPGVQRYLFQHQVAYQKQMEQMMQLQLMQQAVSGAGPRTPKGNPKQITDGKLPVGDKAQMNSAAQMMSPPDTTNQPGQTGMGA